METERKHELLATGYTFARLALAGHISKKIYKGENTIFHMSAFVAADVLDGVVARRWDVDTPMRRAADAITDRMSVLIMGKAIYDVYPASRTGLWTLTAREAAVTATNAIHTLRTGEVVQGHGVHKIGSLATACFGMASANMGDTMTRITGLVANTANFVLASDYMLNALQPHGELIDGIRHIQFDNVR